MPYSFHSQSISCDVHLVLSENKYIIILPLSQLPLRLTGYRTTIEHKIYLFKAVVNPAKFFGGGANQWRNHQPSAEGVRFLGGSGGLFKIWVSEMAFLAF